MRSKGFKAKFMMAFWGLFVEAHYIAANNDTMEGSQGILPFIILLIVSICVIAFLSYYMYRLKKENPRFGKGERACMAIAKCGKQVIASSNFRDIADYCEANDIEYIGLMDILTIAIRKSIYTVDECNKFIHDITIIYQ